MIRSAMAALATALATALLATVLAGSAAAQFPNMCKSYPADWTLSLIEYPDNWLTIVHGPSDYADPLCSRYLVDVKPTLGHDVILKAGYTDDWTGTFVGDGESVPLSQADCSNYRQAVAVYRRIYNPLNDTGTTLVASSTFKGGWVQPFDYGAVAHCRLELESGNSLSELQHHKASPTFPTVFRVAVNARIGSEWKRVKVSASQ